MQGSSKLIEDRGVGVTSPASSKVESETYRAQEIDLPRAFPANQEDEIEKPRNSRREIGEPIRLECPERRTPNEHVSQPEFCS